MTGQRIAQSSAPDRQQAFAAFLAQAGLPGATIRPLAGDASARRYFRVEDGDHRFVLMDAPRPENESMAYFAAVTAWLREHDLSAPEILAADLEAGLLLLEDLGDALFARVLEQEGTPARETELYAAAVDLLADLPPGAAPQGTAAYDRATLLAEARLATDWWAAGAGHPQDESAIAAFEAAMAAALQPALAPAPETETDAVAVLRDYHAENLLWLPGRAGAARVGLLDYQDARLGHPAYDLVSLLEDARRDTDAALQKAMLSRYLDRRGLRGEAAMAFRAAYAALGAQRNLKIVGIFARLCLRDAKPRYLALIPRVWAHLERDLAAPGLSALARLIRETLPPPEPQTLKALAARAGTGAPGAPGAPETPRAPGAGA
ncbi:MAG: phosphotransferase [Pseudomonadota bacterium]